MAAVVTVAYDVADASEASDSTRSTSNSAYWIKFGLGLLLVAPAVKNWRSTTRPRDRHRRRSRSGRPRSSPPPLKAVGLAWSSARSTRRTSRRRGRPPVAQRGVSSSEAAVGPTVSLARPRHIAVPVILYLAGGDRATTRLEGWKSWLAAHNPAVMAVLFLLFGAVLFSEGLRGLTA